MDRLIAERVARNHRYQGPNLFEQFFKQNDDQGVVEEQLEDEKGTHEIYEKYNPLTHNSKTEQLLTRRFLKKYLLNAKTCQPRLTDDTSKYITSKWTELRAKDFEYTKLKGNSKVLPITVRTLESIIRLATAHAKLRLRDEVDMADCDHAIFLLNKTLFQEDNEENQERMEEEPKHKKMDIESSNAQHSGSVTSSDPSEESRKMT